jgi:hypothetical protein
LCFCCVLVAFSLCFRCFFRQCPKGPRKANQRYARGSSSRPSWG